MKDIWSISFQNLDGWNTSAPLHYSLAYMLEAHIDALSGSIPFYLAEAIGCKECPAVKAGKKCVFNTSVGPMPGSHDPNQDIPQFLKFACSGTKGDGYRPCMQGFDLNIGIVYQADKNGVVPFSI